MVVRRWEKKKLEHKNVHNMTSECACACVHWIDFGSYHTFFYAFFPVLFYKLLWIFVLLLRNFYYGIHTYIHRPKHFIAQAPLSQTDAQMGKRVKKCEKLPRNNEQRMKNKKIINTNTRWYGERRVVWLSFLNTCKFATHSNEWCRILAHFSSLSFSICCFRVRC